VPSQAHPVEGYSSFEEIYARIHCCLKLAKGSAIDVLDLFLAILVNDGQGNWNHLSLTGGKSKVFDFESGSKFDLEPVNR
jgi:hypothetical protein